MCIAKAIIALSIIALPLFGFGRLSRAETDESQGPEKIICTLRADVFVTRSRCPVLIEMSLKNAGDAPLGLKQPIGDVYGTARVEIKGPGGAEFTHLRTRYTGLKELLSYHSELGPGETFVAHVLVLCDARGEWVFVQSGRYELRARLQYRDGEAVSSPIGIDVLAEDATLAEKLNGSRDDVCRISLEEALTSDAVGRVSKVLSTVDEYRSALKWVQGTVMLHEKDVAATRQAADAKLDALRESGSPLWPELAAAKLARRYAEAGDTAMAERLLVKVPHRSALSDEARRIIEARKSKP